MSVKGFARSAAGGGGTANPITGSPAGVALTGAEKIGFSQAGADVQITLAALSTYLIAASVVMGAPTLADGRVFVRDVRTGNPAGFATTYGKGYGAVPFVITASGAANAALQIRLRDAASPGTTIQDYITVASSVLSGSNTVTVNLPASSSKYLVDFRLGGIDAGVVTVVGAIGVGEVVAFCGQSLINYNISGGNFTPQPASTMFTQGASTFDWAPLIGTYVGTLSGEFVRLVAAKTGVCAAIVVYSNPGQPMSYFVSGSGNASIKAALAAAGNKISGFVMIDGHSNATASTGSDSPTTFLSGLTAFFTDIGATVRGPGDVLGGWPRIINSIPSLAVLDAGRTTTLVEQVKAAGLAYVATDARSMNVVGYDAENTGVHPEAAGMINMARECYRAWGTKSSVLATVAGPAIVSALRLSGSKTIKITLTNPGTSLSAFYKPGQVSQATASAAQLASQFQVFLTAVTYDGSGNVSVAPLALDATTPATIVSGTEIDLLLAALPTGGDNAVLDVRYRLAPDAGIAVTDVGIYDNQSDSDGLTYGRPLQSRPSALIVASPNSNAPPGAPTVVATTNSSTQINLALTANGTGGTPATYAVQQSTTSDFSAGVTTLNAALPYAGTSTPLAVTGLSVSTQYWFRATATNTFGGPSAQSSIATATTNAPATAPGALVSFAAGAPSSGSIPVTYTAPVTGTTPFTYAGFTSPHGASTWTANGGTFNSTGGSFTGLTNGTSYDVRIAVSGPGGTTNNDLTAGYTPTLAVPTLTTPLARYDAVSSPYADTACTTPATAGVAVMGLLDLYGNGTARNLVQATSGNAPILTASSQNGLPGMTFAAASSQTLRSPASSPWVNSLVGDMTALIVFRTASGSTQVVTSAGGGATFYCVATSGGLGFKRGSNEADDLTALPGGSLVKAVIRIDTANSLIRVRLAGRTEVTAVLAAAAGTLTGLSIGDWLGVAGYGLTGVVYEAIYSGAHESDATRDALLTYATARWGS